MEAGLRTLLVWCPDWPVVAAEIVDGVPAEEPVAVLAANRVLACSEAARRDGVRRGLRRREAQSRCPQLIVVEHDPGRDARAFEPVVAAIEDVVAGVEVVRPGACAVAARGPARYFGGEEAAAERIVEQVAQACAVECQVGIADGVFAAGIAARTGLVVEVGGTRDFLSAVPVSALEKPDLTDLLNRLGVKTLGEFAALPGSDVLTRFGFEGALAHRLASGSDHRPLAVRQPPLDVAVEESYDEPLERVDVAAFAGRALAERLHERLAAHGLACTRLGIEAITADGQELHRTWRHDGTLTAAAIAERVRWQLDGWLTGARRGGPARPTAGLVRLRLVPDGVLVHVGLQPGLWGETGAERDRAHRAFSRVQGLLGPDSVVTMVLGGGRSADDQVRLVPWGDEREQSRPAAALREPIPGIATVPLESRTATVSHLRPIPQFPEGAAREEPQIPQFPAGEAGERPQIPASEVREGSQSQQEPPRAEAPEKPVTMIELHRGRPKRATRGKPALPPWPGRLPRPSPAIVLQHPMPATVRDERGEPVGVSARLELTGAPATIAIEKRPPAGITGWAGPWPVDERWWAPEEARRRARFQVTLEDGRALLLSLAQGRWQVDAIYD
ncbi:DNA polymerase Y family protein [Actinoplanes sp. DH11]|uniref:DNA polymerase Y family protein n=1 Tax=Actinoplanes sp. DH11 TaxID=2857011 RepID=UPI001E42719B|nr:DNA polymerase Y family protein [Actinoplanes sp. DH11]